MESTEKPHMNKHKKVDKEEEALQHKVTLVMQQLELWFDKNDLIVNITKKCAISFHPHQNSHPTRPPLYLRTMKLHTV